MRFVFLMADTFRRDRLGCYGNGQGLTRELDRLARDSFIFDNYYVSSFPTVPNREDTFCGSYGFPHHGWGPLPPDSLPLATIVREQNYLTQLITDTPHLIGRELGYQRGFHAYHWIRGHENDCYLTRYNHEWKRIMPHDKTRMDEFYFGHPLVEFHYWINAERVGEQQTFVAETARATSKWIEDNYKCEDFVLWVDTFECHEPFDPPEYWRERHYPDYDSFPMVYPDDGPAGKYTADELRMLRVNFDGETCLTSKWLGYVLRKLEDVGIYEDCCLCFLSDHGTYLGEHNRTGKFLLDPATQKITPWPQYDEIHRIPLLLKLPGQNRSRRMRQLVQPVDLLPTLLELGGLDSPSGLEGYSLAALLRGESRRWPRRYAFSSFSIRDREPTFWTTVTGGGWSMNVGGYADEPPELFDLRTDPGQYHNVAPRHPEVVARMGRAYLRFLESVDCDPGKIELMAATFRR